MSVSMRAAFSNVLKDKDFLSKYTILVLLSFCNGLAVYASLAKNYALFIPAVAIATLASILAFGYDFAYIKNLISNKDVDMPEWTWGNLGDYSLTGVKYFAAVLLLAMSVGVIILIPVLITLILGAINKFMLVFIIIPFFILMLIELFVCIASQGFVYSFIDTNYDILALFRFKKICSYFSVNYFTALFAFGCLALLNGILATATTSSLRYALFYIIPLLLAPFLRMGINNLMAQAYRAKRDGEPSCVGKMLAYIGCFVLLLIVFGVVYFFTVIKPQIL